MAKTRRSVRSVRSRKNKKQQGGGIEEIRDFNRMRLNHDYINKIGPLKPVATPETTSGDYHRNMINGVLVLESDFQRCIRLWTALSPEDKTIFQRNNKKYNGYTLNAYIDLSARLNPIIFYAEEYLAVLASVSGTSVEEILRMITTKQTTEEAEAIIHVAFGDDEEIMSERGLLLKKSYLSRLQNPTENENNEYIASNNDEPLLNPFGFGASNGGKRK